MSLAPPPPYLPGPPNLPPPPLPSRERWVARRKELLEKWRSGFIGWEEARELEAILQADLAYARQRDDFAGAAAVFLILLGIAAFLGMLAAAAVKK